MSVRTADDAANLVAHIKKHVTMLGEVRGQITATFEHDIPLIGKTGRAAVLVAGLLEELTACVARIHEPLLGELDRFSAFVRSVAGLGRSE